MSKFQTLPIVPRINLLKPVVCFICHRFLSFCIREDWALVLSLERGHRQRNTTVKCLHKNPLCETSFSFACYISSSSIGDKNYTSLRRSVSSNLERSHRSQNSCTKDTWLFDGPHHDNCLE